MIDRTTDPLKEDQSKEDSVMVCDIAFPRVIW